MDRSWADSAYCGAMIRMQIAITDSSSNARFETLLSARERPETSRLRETALTLRSCLSGRIAISGAAPA
jgi:hypothetical protein